MTTAAQCGYTPLHVTRPLADYMSSSLFQMMYLCQWAKPSRSCLFVFLQTFHNMPWNPTVCVCARARLSVICSVYIDVTPRPRVVVECWIPLQGITHRPEGNHVLPTKYQEWGGGGYCWRAGLEELCVTRQKCVCVYVCMCVCEGECVWANDRFVRREMHITLPEHFRLLSPSGIR